MEDLTTLNPKTKALRLITSYSDPKQRHRYVRVGTKGKGRETPKGSPTLNAEAQLSSASFHDLEPKRYGELHSQTT